MVKKCLLIMCLSLLSPQVLAHAMGSSFLHLSEQAPGKFTLRWVPAKALAYSVTSVQPQFPSHCRQQEQLVDCGVQGLSGQIDFANLPLHADILVRIEWLDGGINTQVVNGQKQTMLIAATKQAIGHWQQTFASYMVIGIEHILEGIDHLLFVIGLIILVGFNRSLIWTVTSFTLAHSLTLGLSVTGMIAVAATPVEIIIALSILLVSIEALDKRVTLVRRYPWVVAFIFGLVHGLGFAGALREVGLPQQELPLSLLAFNVGVELGQLGIILCLYLLYLATIRLFSQRLRLQPALIFITYVIGSLGVYWTISRSADLFGLT